MLEAEIASLLEDAGYQFDPETRMYTAISGAEEGETTHASEFVADQLEIPLEDLQRWEEEQVVQE